MYLFKLIYRKTIHNKFTSFINIFCMSIAFGLALTLFLYVQREFSIDKYNTKKDRIVRLINEDGSVWTNTLMGGWVKNKFPEVKQFVRTRNNETCLITYNDEDYLFKGNMLMDSSVFDVFDFNLMMGNKKTVLSDPFSVVLTQKTAKQIFGDKNPIGETISFNKTWDHTVTGVMADIPGNSTFNIDLIFPFHAIKYHWKDSINDPYNVLKERYNSSFHTYLLFDKKTDVMNAQEKICTDLKKEFDGGMKFQPLTDIYFDVNIGDRWLNKGSKSTVLILLSIAIGLIIISVFNFINLSSASSINYLPTLGIRKTIGSGKLNLIKQYFIENSLYLLFSLILGFFIVILIIPYLNNLLHTHLSAFLWFKPFNLKILIGLFCGLFLITGIYPVWLISKKLNVAHVKGSTLPSTNSGGRNILVPAQFIFTIIFIIAAITITKQIIFIKNKDLGFSKDRLLYVIMNTEKEINTDLFKEELLKNPDIKNVSLSAGLFGDIRRGNTIRIDDRNIHFNRIYTDPDYVNTLGYKIIQGRNFSYDIKSDFNTNAYIINETMAKMCGFKNPLDETIFNHPIVGVVKDFNIEPLQKAITPIAFVCNPARSKWVVNIKLANDNLEKDLNNINNIWNKINPDFPMLYSFADDRIVSYYQKEIQFSKLSILFSFISVLLSCFGLIGLVMFTIQNKTKEIGVRKVTGAKVSEILAMLNVRFIKWMVIALIIACPLAHKIMLSWLDNFAYKTSLAWWIFAVAGIIVLLITMLTVSLQSMNSARKNPVEALRYE